MGYQLAEQSGDSLAVPQVVVSHLAQADGDAVRVALYILQTGECAPAALAKALALPSVEAAKRALQYWAGAGLLMRERAAAPLPDTGPKAEKIDLANLNDPYVAVLCEEAQQTLGKSLSRGEMLRLVALYLEEGWQPDVILLCCAEVARQGRHTIAAVSRELERWRSEGVESGEDAERHLQRIQRREGWFAEVARLFGIEPAALTRWERGAIVRWHEEWHDTADMIEEALLRADNRRTIRYVDGILRAWRSQGITTVAAARGQGQLAGSNILSTTRQPPAAPRKDLFNRDWNAVFDDETEG
ncbi:MAG: DnaD domain protein [Gemmiger sp.]